jgi:hypothetical protein
MKNPPMAGFLDFLMDGNVVFMCFFYVFFLLCSPTSYFCDHISERGKDAAGGSILWPDFRFIERGCAKISRIGQEQNLSFLENRSYLSTRERFRSPLAVD